MSTIHPLPSSSVDLLTSGQVILSLPSALKELLENALDASSTSLTITFKESGSSLLSVSDNGSGISPSDYTCIGLKHHTSKLGAFSDLSRVETYGFRGEAISSLCALGRVRVHTCCSGVGDLLTLAADGRISKVEKKARQRGTTVTIEGLFENLPVRRKEFLKNIKREYAKAVTLIQAYALISPGVRWSIVNANKSWYCKSTNVIDTASLLFGNKLGTTLMPLHLDLDGIQVVGAISKPAQGRTSTDRQFFYINARPWDANRFAKLVNEVYRGENAGQAPMVVADFRVRTDGYDVNVSPDKRSIWLHDEKEVGERLRVELERVLDGRRGILLKNGGGIRQGRLEMGEREEEPEQVAEVAVEEETQEDQEAIIQDDPEELFEQEQGQTKDLVEQNHSDKVNMAHETNQEQQQGAHNLAKDLYPSPKASAHGTFTPLELLSPYKRPAPTLAAADSPTRKKRQIDLIGSLKSFALPGSDVERMLRQSRRLEEEITSTKRLEYAEEDEKDEEGDAEQVEMTREEERVKEEQLMKEETEEEEEAILEEEEAVMDQDVDPQERERNLELLDQDSADDEGSPLVPATPVSQPLVHAGSDPVLPFNLSELRTRLSQRQSQTPPSSSTFPSAVSGAGISTSPSDAEKLLSLTIHKEDFARMQILGQFNLGFIIARRDDDLFIIDQHASDEKYNFETLQRETRVRGQRLISPKRLELSSTDELVVSEYVQVLRKNGFQVSIDESAPSGTKVLLHTLPVSQKTTFTIKDFEELLFLLRDSAGARCSKMRAMFASRACRKSVMIGTPLNGRQMKRIVRNMGTIEQPWNCPHGRPTMRHLIGMNSWPAREDKVVNWEKL